MTAVSKEINYEEEMLAPTITMCPVLSTSLGTFQKAEESFLSLEQMFLNFTHKYAENKYIRNPRFRSWFFKPNASISICRTITLSDLSNQTLFSRVVLPLPRKGQHTWVNCAQYHPPVSRVPVSIDYQVKLIEPRHYQVSY